MEEGATQVSCLTVVSLDQPSFVVERGGWESYNSHTGIRVLENSSKDQNPDVAASVSGPVFKFPTNACGSLVCSPCLIQHGFL